MAAGISLYFLMASIGYASALGLLSMGLSLTFVTTKVANFAHGTIAMIGGITTLFLIDRYMYNVKGLPLFVTSALAGFIIAGVTAVVLYLVILKPLADRGSDVIGLMIATFAIDIMLQSILSMILNLAHGKHFPKLFGASVQSWDVTLNCCGTQIAESHIFLPVAAIILTILFHLFLTKTKFGVAMRATIENPDLAEVMGVNTKAVYTVSWFISGALAGLAGALLVFSLKDTSPNNSNLIIVSIFAGSILGGLGNVYWGLIGGFLIGLAEKLGTQLLNLFYNNYLAPSLHLPSFSFVNYEKLMSLGLVIIVLLTAPQGLAGIDWGGLLSRMGLKTARSRKPEREV